MNRLFLFIVILVFAACNSQDFHPDKAYIQQEWRAVNSLQVFDFYSDTKGRMITTNSSGKLDTYQIDYHFEPDSALMQLDLTFNTMPLKGLNLFGVVEFIDRDTFLYYSQKGFPDMGYKYRPQRMDYVKAIPYVSVKN